jgi:hypothetical protein
LGVWILPEELLLPPGDLDTALIAVQEQQTRARANLVARAAEAYCQLRGSYPSSLDELLKTAMPEKVARQCRLNPDDLIDAWRRPFSYDVGDGIATIISSGPDGAFGTDDDIAAARPTMEGARPVDIEVDC